MDDSAADVRSPRAPQRKVCARRGCSARVNKPTAKYCSVRCCSVDPERLEKLRSQARRAGNRPVLPMAHQLKLSFSGSNPEELLNSLCQGREDVPGGMSRLAAGGTLSFGRTPAANDGVGALPRWGASAAG